MLASALDILLAQTSNDLVESASDDGTHHTAGLETDRARPPAVTPMMVFCFQSNTRSHSDEAERWVNPDTSERRDAGISIVQEVFGSVKKNLFGPQQQKAAA
jgi:hypothetical protein